LAQSEDLRQEAKILYGRGATLAEIADSLGRAERTIARWKASDGDAGLDWDRMRDERRRKDPHALLAVLEGRRDDIASDNDIDHGSWADAIYKIQRVIDSLRREIGDISIVLGVLEGLAEWCRENLADDDMPPLRRAIEAYLSHLKRQSR